MSRAPIVHMYAGDGRSVCGREAGGCRFAGNAGVSAVTCKRCLAAKSERRRFRVVIEFDSTREQSDFKRAFETQWRFHEMGFPGTLVFMSVETVEESK